MKIVNRLTFLTLPIGTIYSHYEPCIINNLMIKHETLTNDWYYQDLIGNIKCRDSDEFYDVLLNSEKDGSSFDLDFATIGRDGMYEENQLFAIYEKKDIQGFIDRLSNIPLK